MDPAARRPADGTGRVLVIGGYGNFGGYIVRRLVAAPGPTVIVGGRAMARARAFVDALGAGARAEAACIDIDGDLAAAFAACRPDVVIHTVGPFQTQDYRVARAAIAAGAHYLDLADGRDFVAGIGVLDDAARAAGVLVVAGASSVPCLSAAIIDYLRPSFAQLDSIDYGISAAQHTNRGLATTQAVLGYVGRAFTTLVDGRMQPVLGWMDQVAVDYPELGRRWHGNCDVPDLALFPARYPGIRTIRFRAGHELGVLQFGTWALGLLVRAGVVRDLASAAPTLLALAGRFDRWGSGCSGLYLVARGADAAGRALARSVHVVARSGHGPNIPCLPAVLLARALLTGACTVRGARPCVDLVDLAAYRAGLADLDVTVYADGRPLGPAA